MSLSKRRAAIALSAFGFILLVTGCQPKADDDDKGKSQAAAPEAEEFKKNERKQSNPTEPAKPLSGTMDSLELPTLADVEGYKNWLKMNRQPVRGRTHGLTDIYINQDRPTIAPDGSLRFPFPEGTVIVKQVIQSGWIAIMRKQPGFDPAHNDWQWIEYRGDGSIAGQDADCWECHQGSEASDYVFTKLDDAQDMP